MPANTWTIIATDNVGHTTTTYITTKYDITKPGIDGTEITFVLPDGTYIMLLEENAQIKDEESIRGKHADGK